MSARRALRRTGAHGPAAQVTCLVPRRETPLLRTVLADLGVGEFTLRHARRTLLVERRSPLALRGSHGRAEELVDVVRFHALREHEAAVVDALVAALGLGQPGRGSVACRDVELLGRDASPCGGTTGRGGRRRPPSPRHPAAAVSCIVPRGGGAAIARIVLEAGLGAPVVAFGLGSGRRDRLGLIRITIPVDKEIVSFLLSPHDVDEAFRLVGEVMQIDRPGAGFGFWYPVHRGVVDARIWLGRQPHIASMEQVIAALDGVTGGASWRRRAGRGPVAGWHGAALASLTIHGTEGETGPAVQAVLDAGAGGATLVRSVRERPGAVGDPAAARESSELIVAARDLGRLRRAAVDAGLLDVDGWIETAEVAAASGFRSPSEASPRP